MGVPYYFQSEYTWLLVCGAMAAFLFGFGTGSNDVANAFGTSVGSKTLKMWQAVILAAIFEFVGAMVLGHVSIETIAGGISTLSLFQRAPEVYAYGMTIALFVSGTWNILASYLELNASSTHSIIGSIIGFSLVWGGRSAVNWSTPKPNAIPPYSGVVPICCAWVFAPVLTATASAILFIICRTLVLRRKNAYMLAFLVLPVAVGLTVWINVYFIFVKGVFKELNKDKNDKFWAGSAGNRNILWVTACIAAGAAAITAFVVVPILFLASKRHWATAEARAAKEATMVKMGTKDELDLEIKNHPYDPTFTFGQKLGWYMMRAYFSARFWVLHGLMVDIHKVVEEDPIVAAIHRKAEVFDPKAEHVFSYLQVFSAICVVFAHGAGEVGYMAGPLSTVWYFYRYGMVFKSTVAPYWIIGISASGLVIGLATYGYNVCRAMGTRMAKLSPSRGFAAELATSTIIMVCAQSGLPVSSSQCITGGIIGVGAAEGASGVNWRFFAYQFGGWIFTLLITASTTALLFVQGLVTPNSFQTRQLNYYEDGIAGMSIAMYDNMLSVITTINATALPTITSASPAGGVLGSMTGANFVNLKALCTTNRALLKNAVDVGKNGVVYPVQMLRYLYTAVGVYQKNTILTVGKDMAVLNTACGGTCTQPKTAYMNKKPTSGTTNVAINFTYVV